MNSQAGNRFCTPIASAGSASSGNDAIQRLTFPAVFGGTDTEVNLVFLVSTVGINLQFSQEARQLADQSLSRDRLLKKWANIQRTTSGEFHAHRSWRFPFPAQTGCVSR